MNKPAVTVRTAELSRMMSQCTNGAISPQDLAQIMALLGDSLASYLARGKTIHVERLGTFYVNSKGWIRFSPARTMKERTKKIRQKQKE